MASVRATLGLSDTPSDWTVDQRNAYNNALSKIIASAPDAYGTDAATTAQVVLGQNQTPLDDTGFLSELGDFGANLEDNVLAAGEKIGSIGEGVLNLAGLAKWLIPTAGVIILGIVLYKFYKK